MVEFNFTVDREELRREHFEGRPVSKDQQGFGRVLSCHEADDSDPSPDSRVMESDESIAGTVAALCADFDERCWKGPFEPRK